ANNLDRHSHLRGPFFFEHLVQIGRVDAFVKAGVVQVVKGIALSLAVMKIRLIARWKFAALLHIRKHANRRPIHGNINEDAAKKLHSRGRETNTTRDDEDNEPTCQEYQVIQTEGTDIGQQNRQQNQKTPIQD